jgi:hypothetical protein
MSLKDDNLRFTVLKAIADAVQDEMTRLRASHMTALLERYDDEGTKSFEIRLPGLDTVVATISLSVPKDSIEHTDPEAFEAWLEKNHPHAVIVEEIPAQPEHTVVVPASPARTERFIDPKALTAVMKQFKATPDGVVDTATGVMVDGVENKPGGRPRSFSVRYEADGRDLITQSYRDGKLNSIVSGGPLPAIDAPVIERKLVVVHEAAPAPVAPPVDQEPFTPATVEEAFGEDAPLRYGAEPVDEFDAALDSAAAFITALEHTPTDDGDDFDPGSW